MMGGVTDPPMTTRKQRIVERLLLGGVWVFLILGTDSKSPLSLHFMAGAGLCALALLVLFGRQVLRGGR